MSLHSDELREWRKERSVGGDLYSKFPFQSLISNSIFTSRCLSVDTKTEINRKFDRAVKELCNIVSSQQSAASSESPISIPAGYIRSTLPRFLGTRCTGKRYRECSPNLRHGDIASSIDIVNELSLMHPSIDDFQPIPQIKATAFVGGETDCERPVSAEQAFNYNDKGLHRIAATSNILTPNSGLLGPSSNLHQPPSKVPRGATTSTNSAAVITAAALTSKYRPSASKGTSFHTPVPSSSTSANHSDVDIVESPATTTATEKPNPFKSAKTQLLEEVLYAFIFRLHNSFISTAAIIISQFDRINELCLIFCILL